jgi:hypothetical protein
MSENPNTQDAYAFSHETNVGMTTTPDELLFAAPEVELPAAGKTPSILIVAQFPPSGLRGDFNFWLIRCYRNAFAGN